MSSLPVQKSVVSLKNHNFYLKGLLFEDFTLGKGLSVCGGHILFKNLSRGLKLGSDNARKSKQGSNPTLDLPKHYQHVKAFCWDLQDHYRHLSLVLVSSNNCFNIHFGWISLWTMSRLPCLVNPLSLQFQQDDLKIKAFKSFAKLVWK
jgi:hypothetical protein